MRPTAHKSTDGGHQQGGADSVPHHVADGNVDLT
jgi:hypothetical protein